MKITNVKVDMFNWKSAPWKTGVGMTFGQTRQLGIVTVETDEGVSGKSKTERNGNRSKSGDVPPSSPSPLMSNTKSAIVVFSGEATSGVSSSRPLSVSESTPAKKARCALKNTKEI